MILGMLKVSRAKFPSQMIEPSKTPKPASDRDGLSISRRGHLQSVKFRESSTAALFADTPQRTNF